MSTLASAKADLIAVGRRPPSRSFWNNVGRRLLRDPVTMVCAAIILAITLAALFAPYIAPHDPYRTSMVRRLLPIGSPGYLLGTDELGRDILSRLIWGARLSLVMGISPVVIATAIGGLLGVIAGYAGGVWNMVIMRVIDVFYAFPSVLLAVAIAGVLGAGLGNTIFSLVLVFVPSLARVAESITIQIRGQDYVEAALATGASDWRVVRDHIIPNVSAPIISYASSLISVSIVLASGLSFLGLGVTPPEPEWGLMLNALRQAIYVAPTNAILPGLMIFITSMCFNLMSEGLRAAMDVKQ
ncbi:ABC transporter permease [Aquabacter sediminis]|uniref:ABC transporter permease n=1 Tax=Aquabacter sediminis TaxID=3029197 RepID=UPI00237E2CAF|nr:ABC transporter permease [Aquabacter sp. P-9]MDE1567045.1 ABC transporter permease [Aquabacter sp. P-9]